MSAWIVPKEHIDLIVTILFETDNGKTFTEDDKDAVGQMFLRECWDSIAYRYSHYPDGERPGPVGFIFEEIAQYRYREPRFKMTDGEKASVLGCYSYQSCEHPDWKDSLAHKLIVSMQNSLPEGVKHEGPWGWGEEDIAARERGAPPDNRFL